MSPEPTPLPISIDDVIIRLNAIVEDSIARGDRLGYFAALYNRVTQAVRDGIRAGAFDDNARMARLDVIFANRYLEAYGRHRQAGSPTTSWRVAFDAAQRPELSVLRHLILGMNAHINLDLGVASAAVAPGDSIHALQADFNRINTLLGSLLPTVEAQLGDISPRLGALSDIAHSLDKLDERVGNFSMERARDGAWRFAVRLAGMDHEATRRLAITARDSAVAVIGQGLVEHTALGQIVSGSDRSGVAEHIRILARPHA